LAFKALTNYSIESSPINYIENGRGWNSFGNTLPIFFQPCMFYLNPKPWLTSIMLRLSYNFGSNVTMPYQGNLVGWQRWNLNFLGIVFNKLHNYICTFGVVFVAKLRMLIWTLNYCRVIVCVDLDNNMCKLLILSNLDYRRRSIRSNCKIL
jgi:hypothetical protein